MREVFIINNKEDSDSMQTRRKNSLMMWGAGIVGMLAGIFGIANAEESSILQGATMSDNDIRIRSHYPALDNSLIAGNYKVFTSTEPTNSNNGRKSLSSSGLALNNL